MPLVAWVGKAEWLVVDGSPWVHPYAVALIVGWVLVALQTSAVGPPTAVPAFPVVSFWLGLVRAEDVRDWPAGPPNVFAGGGAVGSVVGKAVAVGGACCLLNLVGWAPSVSLLEGFGIAFTATYDSGTSSALGTSMAVGSGLVPVGVSRSMRLKDSKALISSASSSGDGC